jgi:hypothetical protein
MMKSKKSKKSIKKRDNEEELRLEEEEKSSDGSERKDDSSSDEDPKDRSQTLDGHIKARIELAKTYHDLTTFGIFGEKLFTDTVSDLTKKGAWEMTNNISKKKDLSQEEFQKKAYTCPPCFSNTKLKSLRSFLSDTGDRFEQPLFQQALITKDFLLITSLMKRLLEQEAHDTVGDILSALEQKLIEDLQRLNYERLVARFPNRNTRKLLKKDDQHAFSDDKVIDLVDRTRKLEKKLSGKPQTRTNTTTPTRRPTPARVPIRPTRSPVPQEQLESYAARSIDADAPLPPPPPSLQTERTGRDQRQRKSRK